MPCHRRHLNFVENKFMAKITEFYRFWVKWLGPKVYRSIILSNYYHSYDNAECLVEFLSKFCTG